MKSRAYSIGVISILLLALTAMGYGLLSTSASATGDANTEVSAAKPRKTLRPFKSDKELKDYFAAQERDRRESQPKGLGNANAASGVMTDSAAPVAAAKSEANEAKDDSITNNQHAGVDEGDIVKMHGDHLVI